MSLTLAEKFWLLKNDPAWMTIQLPVEPGHDASEEVLVERVTDGYRIASSPGMVEGLAADDVIELAAAEPHGYRLVRRGMNLCIHLFTQAEQRDRIQTELEFRLRPLGGWLDGKMGSVGLCFTVPSRAGFPEVERAMHEVVGDEWYFSNVYDPVTNEPLEWWLQNHSDS